MRPRARKRMDRIATFQPLVSVAIDWQYKSMQHDLPRAQTYSADELAALSGLPRRTIRYYIQLGLLDRPIGETRAAHYGWQHLSRLLRIREWTEEGYSLGQIGQMLNESRPGPVAAAPAPGTISVQSQVHLAAGLSLLIDPGLADLSPEDVRTLARDVLRAYERLNNAKE